MAAKQYLEKIKALCIANSPNDTDLDNHTMKVLLDNKKFYFNLSDLVIINNQQKEDSEEMINREIINQVADCLDLLFISEKETEGSVCFINSNELRSEFRQSFTIIDLLDYCYAVLYLAINKISEINSARIPITSNSSVFWELVKHGSKLRKKDIY